MSKPDSNDATLGRRLLRVGWRQGVLFHASPLGFLWNRLSNPGEAEPITTQARALKGREKLVLVTQDCDIVASEQLEPYVEALICTVEKQRFVEEVDGGTSARWFVVDRDARLVAQAKYRVQIDKRVLEGLTAEPWPSGPERLTQFVRWLARRYDRPALPDALVDAFQRPVQSVADELKSHDPVIWSQFTGVVRELRVTMPTSEELPYTLDVFLLVRRGELSAAEADALQAVEERLRAQLNPANVTLNAVFTLDADGLSLADYEASRPVYLEHHTYQGQEIEGAEPPRRV